MTEASTQVTRLFGGPGSGKTTALLDRVETLLEENDDVEFRDVLVVSYTRAAAAEIRERLAERLGVAAGAQGQRLHDAREGLRTAQPLARRRRRRVRQGRVLRRVRHRVRGRVRGSRRRSARSTTIGNKIIATSQWLQRTRRDVADWYDVPFKWDDEVVRLPPDIDENAQTGNKYTPTWPSDDDRISVPETIRAWREYKGENDVVGFADMLERVAQRSLLPSVDYLVIDEFQDITTLQYDVYQEWRPHMETVLIAGDDDQVVYAWQGADPDLLLEEQVTDDNILPNSYRLPPGSSTWSTGRSATSRSARRKTSTRARRAAASRASRTLDDRPRPQRPPDDRTGRGGHRDDPLPRPLPDVPVHRRVHRRGHPLHLPDRPADVDRPAQPVRQRDRIPRRGRTGDRPGGPPAGRHARRLRVRDERARRAVRRARRDGRGRRRRGPGRAVGRARHDPRLRPLRPRTAGGRGHAPEGDELPGAQRRGVLRRRVRGHADRPRPRWHHPQREGP
ncbi:UvrD-helicase domain-containing protein [Halosimplex aquaticum]